ncbi:hypothetical protein VE03_05204 [Pseudogymnoascus sp. 23342-1-I1]|nr:hypothetical protein VE03_05204 [Pseudogymnoascus sp. 23342-1-I1]
MTSPDSGSSPDSGTGSGLDPVSGSDPVSGPGPYLTSLESTFISPFTPFLNHIVILRSQGAPIERYCEHRQIYYALCTHATDFIRCHNRHNSDPVGTCNFTCIRFNYAYVTYAEYLCPACEHLGRPEPARTEDELLRCSNQWRILSNLSSTRFFQLVSDAQQEGNLALQDLEDPDDLLRDPDILGQELLAEQAAIELEDERQAIEEYNDEDEDEDGSDSESEDPMEFEIPEPQPDQSEGWVERLPQADADLPRREWFLRIAWRREVSRRFGVPPECYYVPNNASDDTDLLVRVQQPETDGESCAVCITEFSTGDGDDDNVRRLPCGHLFHYECILRWLYNRNCPVCRREYALARMPRFGERDGDSSSISSNDPGQSSSTPQVPPAPGPQGRNT